MLEHLRLPAWSPPTGTSQVSPRGAPGALRKLGGPLEPVLWPDWSLMTVFGNIGGSQRGPPPRIPRRLPGKSPSDAARASTKPRPVHRSPYNSAAWTTSAPTPEKESRHSILWRRLSPQRGGPGEFMSCVGGPPACAAGWVFACRHTPVRQAPRHH